MSSTATGGPAERCVWLFALMENDQTNPIFKNRTPDQPIRFAQRRGQVAGRPLSPLPSLTLAARGVLLLVNTSVNGQNGPAGFLPFRSLRPLRLCGETPHKLACGTLWPAIQPSVECVPEACSPPKGAMSQDFARRSPVKENRCVVVLVTVDRAEGCQRVEVLKLCG